MTAAMATSAPCQRRHFGPPGACGWSVKAYGKPSEGVSANTTGSSVSDLRRCFGGGRKVVWRRTEGSSPLPEGGRDVEIGSVRSTARVIDDDHDGSLLV